MIKDDTFFRQEGWRYAPGEANEPLTINGVVYNEMKGAYASPSTQLQALINSELYSPNSTYHYDSGGDPNDIPNLTYEQFKEFYRRHYHPANSLSVFCGNGKVEEELELLDTYLCEFSREDFDPNGVNKIVHSEPFTEPRTASRFIDIGEQEVPEEKGIVSLTWLLPVEARDYVTATMVEILARALVTVQGAPLKQALIDTGLFQTVSCSHDLGLYDPTLTIKAKGVNSEHAELFCRVVMEKLASLASEGIDRELLEASISREEYEEYDYDSSDFPKSLSCAYTLQKAWILDTPDHPAADLFDCLRFKACFAKIRSTFRDGCFEEVIRKCFLDNKHRLLCKLVPQKGLADKHLAAEAERLRRVKAGMSEEQLADLARRDRELAEAQERQDTQEELATIPTLSVGEMNPAAPQFRAEALPLPAPLAGVVHQPTVLFCDTDVTGITYITQHFEVPTDVYDDMGNLFVLSVLFRVICKMDTERRSFAQFAVQSNMHTGGFFSSLTTLRQYREHEKCRFFFSVGCSFLTSETGKSLELLNELLTAARFDDVARLHTLVAQLKTDTANRMKGSPSGYAFTRAAAKLSTKHVIDEYTSGLTFYDYLVELLKDWETRGQELSRQLAALLRRIVSTGNCFVSATSDSAGKALLVEHAATLFKGVRDGAPVARPVPPLRTLPHRREAISLPGKTVSVVLSAVSEKIGRRGYYEVVKSILNYDVLWVKVRVQGGAYGCGAVIGNDSVVLYSFRDPKCSETEGVYRSVPELLEGALDELSEDDFNKYIIGAVGAVDGYTTPDEKARRAFSWFIQGKTPQDVQREWDELLATTPQNVRDFIALYRELQKDGDKLSLCVGGSTQVIEKTIEQQGTSYFDNIVNVQ